MTTLILFDIDGTLMLADGAGARAMRRAARGVVDDRFSFDGISFAGSLDPAIFREAAARSGLEVSEEHHRRFRDAYRDQLLELLSSGEHQAKALPGTLKLVAELAGRPDLTLGLLTGNYAATAEIKLCHVGFEFEVFEIGAFGDLAETRPALVPVAWRQYYSARQQSPHRTVIVGDTPKDVHCALANGVAVLGVATGNYSEQQLLQAGAHEVAPSLVDSTPLLRLIDSA